jgi:hypothetical protein
MDGMPTSHPERGGSRTPSGKKEYGQDNEDKEHHATDDPALRAGGPLIRPDFLWPLVCHTRLLLPETIASIGTCAPRLVAFSSSVHCLEVVN